MMHDYPNYTLLNGKLYLRTNKGLAVAFYNLPLFTCAEEARYWLVDHNIRANVMEAQ
jgi:hypothetical protein